MPVSDPTAASTNAVLKNLGSLSGITLMVTVFAWMLSHHVTPAAAIGPGLAKAALAVRVGDEIRDLARPLGDGDEIAIVTGTSGDDHLYVMRHSAAHVMAEAVMSLFPGTRFGFGPPRQRR